MATYLWRATVITHRYLGVAVGLLMLVWFFSGIVMMYVSLPGLFAEERIRALAPIQWHSCCSLAAQTWDDNQPIRSLELTSVSGEPAMKLRPEGQPMRVSSLGPDGPELRLDLMRAEAIARDARVRVIGGAGSPVLKEEIELDQWTIGGGYNAHRPLYKFSFDDMSGTTIYVSSATGDVVLWTTASQRFWNWLGAIPHWLYPTILRSNGPLWSEVVIWTSIVGGFLTLIGLYLGIMQFNRGSSGRLSPYRGWFYWHHIVGLVFGVLTLTWVISGMLSMDPWGFLANRPGDERARLVGAPLKWSEVRASLAAIQANPPAGNVVELATAPFDGNLFWLATHADGSVERLDVEGKPRPLGAVDMHAVAGRLAGNSTIAAEEFRNAEDEYYFSHHDQVLLPVYRVILNDTESTRYYVDPTTGSLLRRVTADTRAKRWLFSSLHRLDFPILRTRPLWDIVVVLLMLGGTVLSATGVYLAFWRIKRDFSMIRLRRVVRQPAE